MTEKQKLIYSARYARFNRAHAVKDIYDALVEIITNCDDSYHRLGVDDGGVFISIERYRNKPSLIVIKDRAEGMTLEDMHKKLLNVGMRTARDHSRGFMGRGLRDCLALGTIKVESVKDGCYYACELSEGEDSDYFEELSKGKKADTPTRTRMGIKKDGTSITLKYTSSEPLPLFESLVERLPLHYALRDILSSERKGKIHVHDINGNRKKILVKPEFHGKSVFDKSLNIKGYPDVQCRLQISKTDSPLKDLASPRMRKSGILVVGGRSIHQCTLFNYENRDMADCYYGRLECDYIQRLLEEFDSLPKKDRPANNNTILIDPNRQTGLDRRHPFTKALFVAVNDVLNKLIDADKEEVPTRDDIADAEMRKRFNKLAQFADKFLREHVAETSESDQEATEAARKQGVYILPPAFNIGIGEVRTLTVYVDKSHYDPKRKTRVRSTDDKVIKLVTTFTNEPLHPHRNNAGVYVGSIKVQGATLGAANIIVHPSKHVQAKAEGTVIEKRDEGWRDFDNPFEFERKKYDILEGKTKVVKLFADIGKVPDNGMVARVICPGDKDNSLRIRNGGQCRLVPVPDTNYAVGEISITGHKVIPRALDLHASMGEFSATAKIKVVPAKILSSGFDFKLVDNKRGLGQARAAWDLENNPYLLLIAGTHPSISDYFGSHSEDFPLQNEKSARAMLAEIITDSICTRVLQEEMREKSGDFQYDDKDPRDVLAHIQKNLRGKVHKFSVQAHKILVHGE